MKKTTYILLFFNLIIIKSSFSSSQFEDKFDSKNTKLKVGLVLSGGGTRGFAHLGVLKTLEKYNIPIDLIVGTSMGSVVGGLYAAGYSTDELTEILTITNWEEVLSFSDITDRRSVFYDQKQNFDRKQLTIRFDGLVPVIPSSFTSGQKMSSYINRLVLNSIYRPSPSFDNLKIPLRVVATDLISGKRIIIDKGNLSEAMRASISVPMLYSTLNVDTLQLIDGGLLSNIPVEVAQDLGMDIIIAVDATSPLRNKNQLNAPWEVADQLIGIMVQAANKISLSKASVVIKPELDNFISWESKNINDILTEGSIAAENKIEELKLLLKNESANLTNLSLSENFDIQFIKKYFVSGNNIITNSEIDSIFASSINKPFKKNIIAQYSEKLLSLCRKKGLTLAMLDSVYFDSSASSLNIILNEGIVDQIVLSQNRKTRSWVINRELPFKVGELFTYEKGAQAISNLYATNYFNQVFIDAYYEGTTSKIFVTLSEKESERINLSIRIDNERQLRPVVDMHNENIFGSALEVGGTAILGQRDFNILAEVKSLRFLDSYFNFSVSGYYNLKDLYTYMDDTTFKVENQFSRIKKDELRLIDQGISFTFGRQMEKFGNIILGYRIEENSYYLLPKKNNLEVPKYGVLNFSSFIDDRDKFPYSTEGSNLKFVFETSHRMDNNEKGYTRILFEYEYFQKIFTSFVLHPRITFGSGDKTIPFNKQFSLGGETSFLGLRENDSRGKQLLNLQNEISIKFPFKILFDTYLLARYDIGKVWPTREAIKLKDFYHGFGGGFSIDTPIGPASILMGRTFYLPKEIGKPIVLSQLQVYLSVGYPL